MNKELLKKLNNLKQEVRPDQVWVNKTREVLLTQIKSQTQLDLGGRFTAWKKIGSNLMTMALRPVGAFVLTIGIILSSFIATVGAAKNSVPGDILYPVKITTERAQINLAQKKEKKAALEMQFAERRLAEIDQIIKKTETNKKTDSKIKIALTVDQYKENIQNVKTNLDEMKKDEPAKAVKLAEEIDTKSTELTKTLEDKKLTVESAAKEVINDAITATKETNTKAVDVMVQKHQEGQITDDQKGEVVKTVDDKLIKLTENLTSAEAKLAELKKTEKELKEWYEKQLAAEKAPAPKPEATTCTENCSADYVPITTTVETPVNPVKTEPAKTEAEPVKTELTDPAVKSVEPTAEGATEGTTPEEVKVEAKVIASIEDAKKALEEAKKLMEGGELSKAYNDDIKLVSEYLDKLNSVLEKYVASLADAAADQAKTEPAKVETTGETK